MNPFAQLVEMLVGIYISVILMRFFLQYFRADYYNPLSQFVVKATDPLVKPARRIIPGLGGLDLSTLIVAWLVVYLKFFLIYLLSGQIAEFRPFISLPFALIGVLEAAINLFIFLIIIRVILSWVTPAGGHNPVTLVIGQITEPLMARVRRMLPPTGGLDLSPMLVLILLFFISSSISYYLYPMVYTLVS